MDCIFRHKWPLYSEGQDQDHRLRCVHEVGPIRNAIITAGGNEVATLLDLYDDATADLDTIPARDPVDAIQLAQANRKLAQNELDMLKMQIQFNSCQGCLSSEAGDWLPVSIAVNWTEQDYRVVQDSWTLLLPWKIHEEIRNHLTAQKKIQAIKCLRTYMPYLGLLRAKLTIEQCTPFCDWQHKDTNRA